ncbi:MAG TPA: sialidase family protein [Vicinamibacterales bacterium]|nr:sialidase family protein [Vicinamibacterales bacterium]
MRAERPLRCGLALVTFMAALAPAARAQTVPLGFVTKLGEEMDVRSGGRVLADELTASGHIVLPDIDSPVAGTDTVPQIHLRGGNVQVNSSTEDFVQIFTGFRPFVRATQSEVSTAAHGKDIVVTYNDSTGIHVSPNPNGPGLIVDRVRLSGFATSNDGGKTWTSGFMPPAAGAGETFGDPSVGVDRHGNFFFAQLADDAAGHGTIAVNRSSDGGRTWSDGVIVQVDDGSDKEWLAVGPDPNVKSRDNIYVTWTSFQQAACELRFGRSIDGGASFTAKTILVPTADPNPTHPTNCLQFSNPVVDQITGTLYVPFLRFSNADQDFIQMLISSDAGETFSFATFNIPGAPSPTVMPVTQPGAATECGATRLSNGRFILNFRLTVHGTQIGGPGLTGLPRYISASRMTLQPAAAARNGVVYLAWSNSTSLAFGDLNGGSNVLFIRSDDGGKTWTGPITVNPDVAGDKHHVLPALAIDKNPNDVHVTYYTQHGNSTLDLDMANSHDRGASFPPDRTARVTSTSFDLPPTNIPIPSVAQPFATTNYDRQIQPCYALGEYQSVTTANGTVYAAWGDMRNLLTEPVNVLDPISGQTHPQEDVFFQKVKVP